MLGELLRDPIAGDQSQPTAEPCRPDPGRLPVRAPLPEVLHLPTITGYIVAGLLLSHSVSGVIEHHTVESLGPFTEVALSFIALTIGGEFQLAKLRRTGSKILVITLFEAVLGGGLR